MQVVRKIRLATYTVPFELMPMQTPSTPRAPLTDNPWFWAYLFGAAGLIGAMLLSPKFDARQAQLDGNFTRRTELLEQRAAKSSIRNPEQESPREEPRYVVFSPLFLLVAVGTCVAWGILWWQRFSTPVNPPPDPRDFSEVSSGGSL